MNRLQRILKRYLDATSHVRLGGQSPHERLAADLRQAFQRSRYWYVLSVLAVLGALVAQVSFLVFSPWDAQALSALSGVMGISVAGLLRMLLGLVRERQYVDLLLVAAAGDPESLRHVVLAICRQLKLVPREEDAAGNEAGE
jgi:hypothetical protein